MSELETKPARKPVFKEILRVLLFAVAIPFVTSLICTLLMAFAQIYLGALLLLLPLTVGCYFLFRKALRPYIFWVKAGTALTMLLIAAVLLLIGKGNPESAVFYYSATYLLVLYLPLELFTLVNGLLPILCVVIGAEIIGAILTALLLKLKPGKKWTVALIAAAVLLTAVAGIRYANGEQFKYQGHGFKYMHGYSSTDFTDYTVYAKNSKLVTLPEPASLSIEREEEMPVLDGAEACYPVYAALAKAVYRNIDTIEKNAPERNDSVNGRYVRFTNTIVAFYGLVNGEVDMFFGSRPSADQLEYAASQGVELEMTPIGKEGFIFFVEEDNPVSNLTSDQIRAIYHGDITNWAELGGRDEEIVAFQRPENSGSQTRMKAFMGDVTLKEPVSYEMVSAMEGVITEVADYNNEAGAIGYTFRYFLLGLNQEKHVKVLSVDGIMPTPETISDNSYPLTGTLFLVTRKNETKPNVQKMIDFILSEQGQYIIEETGYGRIR